MAKLSRLIPVKIRITSKVAYEVLFVESFKDEKQVGECRPNDPKQIVIKTGQSDRETFKTYIHEAVHAISAEYPGLNLTENQTLILEQALYKVLTLNKII